ncbi:hypothetical protein SAMN05720764_10810 [Fibrobacter sp. UWH5]|uniref:hypothetical protein n=1 Tax=Fibrobacter sp. UWH5 TaxID=1896211 RepID=UPI00091352A4|nr:hypothetical protein [Fibrobacter sp. UWH5]SHL11917.1 hypothetical protein SAMN05720764_10810 [Fibrobacter sp. UWH5]
MKIKEILNMLPVGYTRLRNSGSTALHLKTEGTDAYLFVKKAPANDRMPKLNQGEIDSLQVEFGADAVIIDWYSEEAIHYMILHYPNADKENYRLVLYATYGDITYSIKGSFSKEGSVDRKKVVKDRFSKDFGEDHIETEMDFAEERYDIIFPDHPLSHCRRVANIISMSHTYVTVNSQITGE